MQPTQNSSMQTWIQPAVDAGKGSVLSAVAIVAVKPFLFATNQRQLRKPVKEIVWTHAYRGTGLMACAVIPQSAIAFGVNKLIMNLFFEGRDEKTLKVTERAFCALFAGGTSALFTNPIEMAVVNLENGWKSSSSQVYRAIHQSKGVSGLMRGSTALTARECIYVPGYMVASNLIDEQAKNHFKELDPFVRKIASAVVAGGIVGALTTPLNALRVNRQSMKQDWGYKRTVQELGIRGLFQGVLPRTGALMIATVIMSLGKQYLDEQSKKSA